MHKIITVPVLYERKIQEFKILIKIYVATKLC